MEITEYWARLVASGLAPDWDNVWYAQGELRDEEYLSETRASLEVPAHFEMYYSKEPFKLREEGIDLYRLEWRKPTKEDVKKMCWFINKNGDIIKYTWLNEVECGHKIMRFRVGGIWYRQCLLADYGQIAPTVADFKRIYG